MYRVLAGLPAEAMHRGGRCAGSASACCATTSKMCSSPTCAPASARVQQQLRDAGASLEDVRLPHAAEIAADLPRDRVRGGRGDTTPWRSRARRPLSAGRAPASRGRAVRAGRGLPARACGARGDSRGSGRARSTGCDVLLAPTLPIEAPPIGASDRHDRRHSASGAKRDAAADAAVQHQRPPRRHDPVRATRRAGLPCGVQLDRPARRHPAAARGRARVRALREARVPG